MWYSAAWELWVLAGYVAVLAFLHCGSGDGGVRHVAGDSARAAACRATGDGLILTLALCVS